MSYQETVETVEKRVYPVARQVVLNNPFSELPDATFQEVWRMVVDGALVSERPTGRHLCMTVGSDPIEIPLLDSNDAVLAGQTITAQQIAYYLRCAYFFLARAADAGGQS